MSILDALDDRFFREVFLRGDYPVDQSAKIVVDAGALALEYSIAVYPYAEYIVAMEPHPEYAADIRKHLVTLPKIHFMETALASTNGEMPFSHFEVRGGSRLGDYPDKIMVQAMNLQTIMEQHSLSHIDVLKMDIEGGEQDVLMNNFPFDKVDRVFMETHFSKDYRKFFEDNGFLAEQNRQILVARRRT